MIIRRLIILQAVLLLGLGSVFLMPRKAALGPAGISLVLPDTVGRWTAGPVQQPSKLELEGLAPDTQFLRRFYTNPAGDQVEVSIVLSGADMVNSIHRPERCLAAQGWTVERSQHVRIPMPEGQGPLDVVQLTNVREFRANEKAPALALKNLNYYWFIGAHENTSDHLKRTFIDMRDRVLHGENQRWAYVTVGATVTDNVQAAGRNAEDTARIVEGFLGEIVPRFQPGVQTGGS